ncbi:hypothetical protein L9G74_19435 [Shewanella sp. C32]|uniref:Lumazine-binding protein n=1 Tax=Shewanella electrica TaxID=515560 RepID=A0ABT2FSH1_9GAMM|nr:hypothetical protein [Shewanella electrica]MCH1926994.1 hypothetical protein [Shewanella electrica]MCS4558615.1 hypothetical protein [Shewanella electrica]
MSNSVGNEENGFSTEGTTMKGILAVIATTLLMSATAQAEQPNFSFNATDNQDPIFVKKCLAYKQALVDGDKQKLLSFVDPKLQEKFGERLQNMIDKMIEKRQKMMKNADYKIDDIHIVKTEKMIKPDADISAVSINYSAALSGITDSCIFKHRKDNTWEIEFN